MKILIRIVSLFSLIIITSASEKNLYKTSVWSHQKKAEIHFKDPQLLHLNESTHIEKNNILNVHHREDLAKSDSINKNDCWPDFHYHHH